MTSLASLWLPILLSAVLIFVVSALIHMFSPWHKGDYARLPNEDAAMIALRPLNIPPGDYLMPRPATMADMKSEAFLEKMRLGPNMIVTVLPNGQRGMGAQFVSWFIYLVIVSLFAAYITSRAVSPGSEYLEVFRFAGTTAFIGHGLGLWPQTIWYHRKWSTTAKMTVDALIYGLLTAGVFGWLWPR